MMDFFEVIHEPRFYVAGGVLFASAALQSTVGFGYSLFSVPLMMFAGFSLPQTVAIAIIGSTCQRSFFAWKMREHIGYRQCWPVALAAILALPLGVWIQFQMNETISPARIRQFIGIFILIAIGIRLAVRVPPQDHLHWFWGILAGGFSGITHGAANVGGPPLVLWAHSHSWKQEQLRVAALAISIPMIPFQLLLQYIAYGSPMLTAMLLGLTLGPASILGNVLGMKLGRKLSVRVLRILVFSLLAVIALVAIVKPLLKG